MRILQKVPIQSEGQLPTVEAELNEISGCHLNPGTAVLICIGFRLNLRETVFPYVK